MKICKDIKGYDKLLHMLAGFAVAAAVGGIVAHLLPSMEWVVYVIALFAAVVAGFCKEYRDIRKSGNHFCLWDWLATIIGGLFGAWVGWLASHFIDVYI